MQIIGRSVGAALAMGNACVLKPAEEACLTALAFAASPQASRPAGRRAQRRAGPGEEVARRSRHHAGVQHLLHRLGGHRAAGAGGGAKHHSRDAELGGKSPQIVFADADLDAALPFPSTPASRTPGRPARPVSHPWSSGRSTNWRRHGASAARALKVGPALADLDVGPADLEAPARDRLHYLGLARCDGLKHRRRAGRDRGPTRRRRLLRASRR